MNLETQDISAMAIEPAYCDEWETVITVDIAETDNHPEICDVWIVAGVPDYLRGTAQAAAPNAGLESVWVFGDSPDMWCPDALRDLFGGDYGLAAGAIETACQDAAVELHRDRMREQENEEIGA